MAAAKKTKKSSELQFVYEEEAMNEETAKVQEVVDDDDAALEFSAATVIAENPLMNNADEAADQIDEHSEIEDGVEISEEAVNHNTATVVHLKREDLNKHENEVSDASGKITVDSSAPKQLKVIPKREVTREVIIREAAQTSSPTTLVDDAEIQAHIYEVKTHAEVKVAVAEFKAEFLAEHLGEAKALEFQVKQLLKPLIKSNNPALLKQAKRIQMLLEAHSKGTVELVKEKAKADKIMKPTQEKVTEKMMQAKKIKKAA